jgi:hypothetical protein
MLPWSLTGPGHMMGSRGGDVLGGFSVAKVIAWAVASLRESSPQVPSPSAAVRTETVVRVQCTLKGALSTELEPAAFDALTPHCTLCPCSLLVTASCDLVAPGFALPATSQR